MTAAPLFSIVAATRNSEAQATQCIASIRAQTMDSWELHYIDDASEDATAAVAIDAASSDTRITVRRNAERKRKLANVLAVLPQCRGAIIAIIDGDDYLVRDDALALIAAKYDAGYDATYGRAEAGNLPETPRGRYIERVEAAWMPHSWRAGYVERALAEHPSCMTDPATGALWESAADIALVSPACYYAPRMADVGEIIYGITGARECVGAADRAAQASCTRRIKAMWMAIEAAEAAA